METVAVFTRVTAGSCVAGIVRTEVSVTSGPCGGLPVAVAVFVMCPVSTSAAVVV